MAFGAFGIITTEFGVIGILPAIARDFRIPIETAGWLVSGFALTIAVIAPFITLATASINRKTVMILALSLFVLSNLTSAVAGSFPVLLLARILPAILHPVYWSVACAAAARQVPPEQAPKAVSIILAGLSVATVLGVPLTAYVADLVGWRVSFIVPGVMNLIAVVALLVGVPSMPVKEKPALQSELAALKNPRLWLNLVATLIMIAGMFSSYSYLADLLEKETHMNGAQVSAMLLLFGGAGIVGNWLMGISLSKNVLLTTRVFLISLVAVYALAYVFGGWFFSMIAILVVWGFVHTGGFLIGQTRITAEAPAQPELATSMMVSFGNAGVTLGTFLGGAVIAGWGTRAILLISIGLMVVTFALSFVILSDRYNRSCAAA